MSKVTFCRSFVKTAKIIFFIVCIIVKDNWVHNMSRMASFRMFIKGVNQGIKTGSASFRFFLKEPFIKSLMNVEVKFLGSSFNFPYLLVRGIIKRLKRISNCLAFYQWHLLYHYCYWIKSLRQIFKGNFYFSH